MSLIKTIVRIIDRSLISGLVFPFIFCCTVSCGDHKDGKKGLVTSGISDSVIVDVTPDEGQPATAMLVLPRDPRPGEPFRIVATGGENLRKAQIIVRGPSGSLESVKITIGGGLPYWRIDDYAGNSAGKYKISLIVSKEVVCNQEFIVSPEEKTLPASVVWRTLRGWDSGMEAIYSAWINALFYGCSEGDSWSALHEVTQNPDRNFLYDFLSLGEDDPKGKNRIIMQPDCADNPFFLRAYFAWKLGLPFGYHECNRGSLGHNPKTGKWITNETTGSNPNQVLAFNRFLRKVMDGVHSGTARTALDDENSDYYPVSLDRGALRPGTVFADPYGHTLILAGWIPQTNDHPGLLLALDAQPDGTIGIKRFWKGNFLFNTTGVIGEPGFKAFRPISFTNGEPCLMKNESMNAAAGFVPFSLQQRRLETDVFYNTMERLINPEPLNAETAFLDLIQALYEQLLVRVTSVANGETYFKSHPGSVIPMPSGAAGIFQAGGQWENFSTPNRDLRLLIAMDAVLDFPELVVSSPEDFNISGIGSPEQVRKKLQALLDQKVSELSISYVRTDASIQKLTVGEILKRRDAFEMAYNPNDGIEIRWGAPEGSNERSVCRRHAPSAQLETMRSVRTWFTKRLHPPT
ncbi:MAG: hypothetical protein NT092_07500 [Bacteroidia bacterium]|nr:hypothetical protein [Bacteroidia bacterium]